jgi:hypothetical protein
MRGRLFDEDRRDLDFTDGEGHSFSKASKLRRALASHENR